MLLKILIGDAQPRVRFGLRKLLDQQPGWVVTGEAEDASALLAALTCGCPNLVLLDWELPGIPAQDLLLKIRQACPDLWIIFMSGNVGLRQAALQVGADVFVYKADPPEKLLGLIQGLAEKI
jgi:DNA-binding NarL/FixJ family response regulator